MSGIKNILQHNATAQANSAFLQELKNKLPQYFTAEKTETVELDNGQTETKVLQAAEFQIEKFLADLAQNNISEARDGYRLSFVGKDYARLQTGMASETVIVPDTEHNQKTENKNSQNVFITGDNLEALRHLQNAYAGAVKMIYIDPPYNTGKEFVYNDKFDFSDEKLKSQLGYSDEEINRLKSIQGKSSHSAWLTFMYPRLKIAQKLLKDDGVIFVSIDDNEQANLKLLMDDVFGEGNFVASIIWQKKYAATNDAKGFSTTHDYIISYHKSNHFKRNLLPRTEEHNKPYKNDDNDGKGLWRSGDLLVKSFSKSGVYPVINPHTQKEYYPPVGSSWRANKITMDKWLTENRIYFGKDGKGAPQLKRYLNEVQQGSVPTTWWKFEDVGHNDAANRELRYLFDNKTHFDTPKPTTLIKQMLLIATNQNDLILDFFAGSATTADAVMQLNAEDGGNRKYIMVQWNEATNSDSAARQAGYQTIDQISRERIKRAAAKIRTEQPNLPENIDLGFKHYRLATPTVQTLEQIETFDPSQQDLFAHDMLQPFSATALNIDSTASGIDTLLQTWLINDGHPFNTAIEVIQLADYQAYYLKDAQTLYLLAPNFSAPSLKVLLNQIGTHQLLVSSIILYPYSFSFTELQQLKTNIKTNLDHAPQIIERF